VNKKAVLLIFVSILLFSFVSGIAFVETRIDVADSGKPGQGVLSGSGESEGVDWWPMFQHDPSHTGYSTSKAPKTNDTLWSTTVGENQWIKDVYSPAVVDGKVYANSRANGYLNCLNASTGEQIWRNYTGSETCPAVAYGRVYSGGANDQTIHCLNASTGEEMWSTRVVDRFFVYSAPAVEDGKLYICGSGGGGSIFCFNATTGEQIWKFDWNTAADISSPAVVDGRVYAHADGSTRCLNASTGEQIWAYFIEANSLSSPTVADGRVYVGAGAKLVCLNASTGELLWEHEVVGQWTDSSSAVAYGRVYVGFYDHNVYCLNASTGEQLWKCTTGGDIAICSPAIASGKVYITSSYADYKLYCLNAFTGDFIWAYKLGEWTYKLSPTVADGKLYSGSGDGKVYCFGGHDVAVVDTSPSSTEAYAGDTINVTVTARNEGTFNETFSVRTYYDSTLVGTQTITDLPQDEEKTLTFSWNTTDVPGGYYTISANATTVPGETDIADNNFIYGTITVTSPVRIAEVIPCNQTGNPKGTFQRGTIAYFKVTINSTALIPQSTLITINLYDNTSITLSVESIQGPTWPGTSTIIFGLSIPATATIGTATVYACAYTDWPSLGGFPHCPEMSVTLEITGS